jgi:copper chaperone CopZ
MFNLFKKFNQPAGESITLKLAGMHCTSCALNIDGTLEETPGIIESNTSYAKSQTTVIYSPKLITPEKIKQIIKSTGYSVV